MTHLPLKVGLAALALFSLGACSAYAQSIGEQEYVNNCASCHGEGGMGDGPLANLMTVPVPDLTVIAANNDGVFPMLEMIQVIDGRTGIRGHGYPMPVWGQQFQADAADVAGPYGSELMVRGRVLELAEYLASIQQ
ncbi:c-type cytochrome [Nioella ostreopsis]|jgi:mono/diheme cytochrome c family protein|uniref:c-type cytochrome n=1 Tax=Nioella ostreopsis TaxID=2448479 RepID=UPI000FDB78D0|nr:c-type cytochrome [Nioella ostreopsis]